MRYHVEFRYDEDTGEVQMIRVETVGTGRATAGHDSEHERVAHDLATVLEPGAHVEEVVGAPPAEVPLRVPPSTETPGTERRATEL